MKRITPDDVYQGLPCSVVAVGSAAGITDICDVNMLLSDVKKGIYGEKIKDDGYLSLKGLNSLIRAKMSVRRRENYRRGERPALRDWAHAHLGKRAVVCVYGHYLYFDGRDYHSFLWNGGDPVVSVWYLD